MKQKLNLDQLILLLQLAKEEEQKIRDSLRAQ